MKFQVTADRTTVYEVDADSPEQAIDAVVDGAANEVDGTTHKIVAVPLCPNCDYELTNKTTRLVQWDDVELVVPSFCPNCNVSVPENPQHGIR